MHFRAAVAWARFAVSALLVLPLPALPLASQEPGGVRGTISSDLGGTMEGAQIRLFFGSVPTASTESDESGRFSLVNLRPGPARLEVRRLGFRPETLTVTVVAGDPTVVAVRMVRAAVELRAVRVLGRRDVVGPMAGFYKRQQTGSGRFFNHQDIDRRNPNNMSDLLRSVPGIRIESRGQMSTVRIRGNRCAPLVWLDGQALMAGEVDLDAWDPRTFDGVEVYSGPASVPVEFQRDQRMSSSCGTIVLWSRQPVPREPKRKKGELTPAAQIAALLEQGRTYLPQDVDRSAAPDSAHIVKPIYPDSLFDALSGGKVIAEIVITQSGVPLMDTFSAVTFTDRSLVEPVRRAIREQRFVPAVRQGVVVQQVLQLPFEFVPDSTARRRR